MKCKRVLKSHTLYTEKSLIWEVDNVSIQARSPIKAGFTLQAGGSRSLVLEVGACIRIFMVSYSYVHVIPSV